MSSYLQIVSEILASSHIIITSHKSPDGDSVGSSLGLFHFIQKLGKQAIICHPDPGPEFLMWLEGAKEILTLTNNRPQIEEQFAKADLLFCLDYNGTDRVGEDM